MHLGSSRLFHRIIGSSNAVFLSAFSFSVDFLSDVIFLVSNECRSSIDVPVITVHKTKDPGFASS